MCYQCGSPGSFYSYLLLYLTATMYTSSSSVLLLRGKTKRDSRKTFNFRRYWSLLDTERRNRCPWKYRGRLHFAACLLRMEIMTLPEYPAVWKEIGRDVWFPHARWSRCVSRTYDGQIPVLILRLQNDAGKQMYMDNWSFFLVKYTIMFFNYYVEYEKLNWAKVRADYHQAQIVWATHSLVNTQL